MDKQLEKAMEGITDLLDLTADIQAKIRFLEAFQKGG